MTQDVLLTISGLHQSEDMAEQTGDMEPIEVITPAKYFLKNGKHYILYDEVVEGVPGVIKNKIKIVEDGHLEIIKTGITNSHMVFERGKTYASSYATPFGMMAVETKTRALDIIVQEDLISVDTDYTLYVNEEVAAECRIVMTIKSKKK